MIKRFLLAVLGTVIAGRNSEKYSSLRPYSTVYASEHHKNIADRPLVAKIVTANLGFLKYLNRKKFINIRPPDIKRIRPTEIVSEFNNFDPKEEEKNVLNFLKGKDSESQRVSLALLSLLGIGDFAPSIFEVDGPPEHGGVNMIMTENEKNLQIIDIDNLGLEIDLQEPLLYRLEAFKKAFEILDKNPNLLKKAQKRLKYIYPEWSKENIETLFSTRISLIKEIIADPAVAYFEKKILNRAATGLSILEELPDNPNIYGKIEAFNLLIKELWAKAKIPDDLLNGPGSSPGCSSAGRVKGGRSCDIVI